MYISLPAGAVGGSCSGLEQQLNIIAQNQGLSILRQLAFHPNVLLSGHKWLLQLQASQPSSRQEKKEGKEHFLKQFLFLSTKGKGAWRWICQLTPPSAFAG